MHQLIIKGSSLVILLVSCTMLVVAQPGRRAADSVKNAVQAAVYQRLALSSHQIQQMQAFVNGSQRTMDSLKRQPLTQDQRRRSVKEIFVRQDQQLKALLTNGQWEQYEREKKEQQNNFRTQYPVLAQQVIVE